MTESGTRRHGLESALQRGVSTERLGGDVMLEVRADGGINLRGNPSDRAFRDRAEHLLGQPLPVTPNTSTRGAHTICWLGPDEWLVLSDATATMLLAARLAAALDGCRAAVNDVGGGQVRLRLAGGGVRDLLSKGCTLDFHPASFPPGGCAQSGLAKASALFLRDPDHDGFDLVVRRSFADYVLRWLRHSAAGE